MNFLMKLLCTNQAKALAWSLNNRHEEWIAHESERPTVVHIVHATHTFSLVCIGDGMAPEMTTVIGIHGQVLTNFHLWDRQLVAESMRKNVQSLLTIKKPLDMKEAA